ncbi:spore germination protein [Abyssisolibacter fermentans]|uniref:spore germination protein n=1 Tax=Abyssisolibacter fermentans TaxID=1766203 RepID=UPI00083734A7|nr:spore germination protein [Abyssisolibacter fermentans]
MNNLGNSIKDKSNNRFEITNMKIFKNIVSNVDIIKKAFDNCNDIVIRQLNIGDDHKFKAVLIYIEGMVNTEVIEFSVINKLTNNNCEIKNKKHFKYLLGINENDITTKMDIAIKTILQGGAVLLIDRVNYALLLNYKNPPKRDISEPPIETNIRGPREGFTESLTTNVCLLRKRIKSIHLKVEYFIIGKQTKTDIEIVYLDNIADKRVIEKVRARLEKIDANSIVDSSYIEEYIADGGILNVFPTIFHTEKPDTVARKILQGKVALLIDGSPTILTVPCTFIEHLQAEEDYYNNYILATIDRVIRFFSFLLAMLLPAFWVSISTFHQELIPTSLVVTVVKARSGLPFPTLVEAFFMLGAYEIIKEAGIRMPEPVGQAISVVGALVLGQSAVSAGLVSTPMVIVIAVTGITGYVIPSVELTRSLIFPKYIFLFLGGSFGLIGLLSGQLFLLIYLLSLRSFGVPYLYPFGPLDSDILKDNIYREPINRSKRKYKISLFIESIRKKLKGK